MWANTNSITQVITFASRGRIGIINPDGTGERYLDFDVPNQAIWQFGPQFQDGRRILLHSYEDGRTWLGNVRSHIWSYDLANGVLTEVASTNRLAPFMVCPVMRRNAPSCDATRPATAIILRGHCLPPRSFRVIGILGEQAKVGGGIGI